MSTPPYYGCPVAAHGSAMANVLMAQEAPGPEEDAAGIPSVGRQGSNFFRHACDVGVLWARKLQQPRFVWPCYTPDAATLAQLPPREQARLAHRHRILEERRKYITFTNGFDRWPKPSPNALKGFLEPRREDILSEANKARLRAEVQPQHNILLLGGAYAYLAYTGTELAQPSQRQGTRLTKTEFDLIERHLGVRFEYAWYMGHTRRWHLGEKKALKALKKVARLAGWMSRAGARVRKRP
jgi:hypothetical protein